MRSMVYALEYKRSLCFLRRIWMVVCLVLLLTTAGIVVIGFGVQQQTKLTRVELGLLIPTEEEETKQVADFAATLDSIKSVCHITYYTERSLAFADVQGKKLDALVIFPENFYADVDSGINTPAQVYVRGTPGAGERLFGSLVDSGVSLLQTAEAGVYTMIDLARQYEVQIPTEEIGDYMMYQYVKKLLVRDISFSQTVVSPIGERTLAEYLFEAVLMCALLIPGLMFGYFYPDEQRTLQRQLSLLGLHAWNLSVIRVLVLANVLWIGFVCTYLGGWALSVLSGVAFVDFSWQVIWGSIFLCLVLACIAHGIYSVSGQRHAAAGLVLGLDIVLLLSAGFLIPGQFLPELLQRLSTGLALPAWSRFLSDLLYGFLRWQDVGVLACYGLVFFLLGVYGTWKNTGSGCFFLSGSR